MLHFASSEICSVLKHSEIISAPWSGVALHSTVWRGVWGRGHGSQAAPHQGIELQPSGNSCWFSCLAKPVLPAAIYVQTFILYEWLCVCACVGVSVSSEATKSVTTAFEGGSNSLLSQGQNRQYGRRVTVGDCRPVLITSNTRSQV